MTYEDDKPKPGGKWVADKLFYAQPNIEFCAKCKRVVKFCTCKKAA